MKYIAPLLITILCTTHSTYPMEEEKKINTKGITPLFDPADEKSIKHFNHFHERAVNHTRGNLLSLASSGEEYKKQLILAKIDLKLLRNQCERKGPEIYLTELIQQHKETKGEEIED